MQSFQEGDRVRSLIDAQHLQRGEIYTVVQINTNFTPVGEIVQYDVEDHAGDVIAVANGHVVLELVDDDDMRLQMTIARGLAEAGGYSFVACADGVRVLLDHGFDDDTITQFEAWCARRGGAR